MTPDDAKKIRDAFGPCSVVYECMSLNEMIKDAADMTNKEWVQIMMQVEEVTADRQNSALADTGLDTAHRKSVEQSYLFLQAMRMRLSPWLLK